MYPSIKLTFEFSQQQLQHRFMIKTLSVSEFRQQSLVGEALLELCHNSVLICGTTTPGTVTAVLMLNKLFKVLKLRWICNLIMIYEYKDLFDLVVDTKFCVAMRGNMTLTE